MKFDSKLLEEIISEEIFQLLLEDRVEFIQQTYPKKLAKQLQWRQQNDFLNSFEISMLGGLDNIEQASSNLIKLFFSADPTTSMEYSQWMIKRFLKNEFRVEDIGSKLGPYLETFHSLKQRNIISGIDINKLSTSQMMDIVEQNEDKTSARQEQAVEADEFVSSGDAEIFYNSKNYKIIIPKTEEASCHFGKGTRWCTAATRGDNMFSHYSEDGPLYIIIDRKTNEKFQFQFETSQFMDARDEEIGIIDFLVGRPELRKVFEDKIKISKLSNDGFLVKTKEKTEWFNKNKELHREDGQAVEKANGTKYWFLNGELHREDGPAIEWSDGLKKWYLNGELHREDGPAIEWPDGLKKWYLNGELHREDGPAIEWPSGGKEWWFNGKIYSESGWKEALKTQNLAESLLLEDRVEFIQQTYLKKLTKQLKWRWENNKISNSEIDMLDANPNSDIQIPFSATFTHDFDGHPNLEDFASPALNLLNLFLETDSTPNKQNSQWMIKRFLQDEFRVEDIGALGAALEQFELLKRNKVITGVDINQLSVKQLRDLTREKQDSTPICQQDLQINSYIKSGQAKLMMNTSDFKVIVPVTKEASCYFGKNTDWCTATPSETYNMFTHYMQKYKSPLYIIIQCHGGSEEEYWQFHFETEQFMDSDDRSINLESWFDVRPEMYDFFDKIKPPRWERIAIIFTKDQNLLKSALMKVMTSYEEYNTTDSYTEDDDHFWYEMKEFLNRIYKNKNLSQKDILKVYEDNKKIKEIPGDQGGKYSEIMTFSKQVFFLNGYFKNRRETADPEFAIRVFKDLFVGMGNYPAFLNTGDNTAWELSDNFFSNPALPSEYLRKTFSKDFFPANFPKHWIRMIHTAIVANPNLPADIVEEILADVPNLEDGLQNKLPVYDYNDNNWPTIEKMLMSAAPSTESFKLFALDKIKNSMLRIMLNTNTIKNMPVKFLETVVAGDGPPSFRVEASRELKRRQIG
jgi:hypothetical protein